MRRRDGRGAVNVCQCCCWKKKVLWDLLKLLLPPQWESYVELIHRVTSERSLLGNVPNTISASCHFWAFYLTSNTWEQVTAAANCCYINPSYILDPLCIQVNVEGQIVSASDLQECLLHSVQCKTNFIIMMIIEKGNVTEAIFVLTVNRHC